MQTHRSSTPFGPRPYTLAMAASEATARRCPAGIAVHKWEAFRAVCEGKAAIGVSERALAVLNALLTFHPETVLTGDADLVVFPSNQALALRAHGMAASTLRRHLAVLVDRGLVIRRDSPNGKRFLRRGREGEEAQAFGFDLKPFVARAAEFETAARAVREERRAVMLLRERITIARRDVAKMVAAGAEEGVDGDWEGMRARYGTIVARLPRSVAGPTISSIAEELEALREEAAMLLERRMKPEKTNTNESRNEHLIQNSNPNQQSVLEPVLREDPGAGGGPPAREIKPPRRTFPLAMVLDACPDIADYARNGISSWAEMTSATDVARGALGISPSAYDDAQAAMGRDECAVVVAAILQKGAAVNNAGAYLRGLTSKAREGGFSPAPMLLALLRLRAGERRRA